MFKGLNELDALTQGNCCLKISIVPQKMTEVHYVSCDDNTAQQCPMHAGEHIVLTLSSSAQTELAPGLLPFCKERGME